MSAPMISFILVMLLILITFNCKADNYQEIQEQNSIVIESTYLEDIEMFKSIYHKNAIFSPGNALINDVQADWMVYTGELGVELFASIAFWLDARIVSLETVSLVDYGDRVFECGRNVIRYFDLPEMQRYYFVLWRRDGDILKIMFDRVLPKGEDCLGGEFFVYR